MSLFERCATPGMKIRSKGKGRGLARGKGEGPIGEPAGDEMEEDALDETKPAKGYGYGKMVKRYKARMTAPDKVTLTLDGKDHGMTASTADSMSFDLKRAAKDAHNAATFRSLRMEDEGLTESGSVTAAQGEVLTMIKKLRAMALSHTKRLTWAGDHGEKYQDAARAAKRGLQQMVQQLGYLH